MSAIQECVRRLERLEAERLTAAEIALTAAEVALRDPCDESRQRAEEAIAAHKVARNAYLDALHDAVEWAGFVGKPEVAA